MARPTKTKIDYFPIDCNDDDRMKLIELKHGLVAYAVYVKLLQKIYGNKGYYLEWNEDNALLFSGEYGIDPVILNSIITDMLKREIFDLEMYEKHSILTSKEIQEQYFFVIAKRRVKNINESYCIINLTKTGVIAAETPVIAAKTGIIANNNTHSIGEDSIVKESIVKESIGEKTQASVLAPAEEKARGEFNNVILTEAEYDALCSEYKNIDRTIERLSQYMAASGKKYSSHYAVLKRWAQEDKKEKSEKSDSSSYDVDEFFKSALCRSYGDDMVGYLTG